MKLKSLIPVMAVLCMFYFVAACNNADKDEAGTTDAVEESLPTRPELTTREGGFVAYVIENNAEALALIHSAMKKGGDAGLRSGALKMLPDHEKLDSSMRDYAKRKGVTFDELDVVQIVDIDEDQGYDWDRDWANEMRTRHKRMVRKFERAQDYVREKELKAMTDAALPALRSHLVATDSLRRNLKRADR